jgi:hypothetical protein
LWGHFDGSVSVPAVSTPPTAAEDTALTQWNKDDLSAKALLTHCIPDSTLICVHGKPVEVGDSSLSKNAVYVVTASWLCA